MMSRQAECPFNGGIERPMEDHAVYLGSLDKFNKLHGMKLNGSSHNYKNKDNKKE